MTGLVCGVALLILGAGWFALGQNTNTTELTPGMETPLIKNMPLIEEVENLKKRVEALEATIDRLENELSRIKNNKK